MKKGQYRFFIPYVNKEGKMISEKVRRNFVDVLETESCIKNGGFTYYEARGGYAGADKKTIVREHVTIFETYGQNPLEDARLSGCCERLSQESLLVVESNPHKFIEYKPPYPYKKAS